MIRNEIQKFLALAPLIMPDLIKDDKIEESDIAEKTAILYFSLKEKLPIAIIMDSCDTDMELLMLYHATNNQVPKLQHCCFFPIPSKGDVMFKLNIVSDQRGYADGITITIYDANAHEFMQKSLEDDIAVHSPNFKFTEVIKDNELLSLFQNML